MKPGRKTQKVKLNQAGGQAKSQKSKVLIYSQTGRQADPGAGPLSEERIRQ